MRKLIHNLLRLMPKTCIALFLFVKVFDGLRDNLINSNSNSNMSSLHFTHSQHKFISKEYFLCRSLLVTHQNEHATSDATRHWRNMLENISLFPNLEYFYFIHSSPNSERVELVTINKLIWWHEKLEIGKKIKLRKITLVAGANKLWLSSSAQPQVALKSTRII